MAKDSGREDRVPWRLSEGLVEEENQCGSLIPRVLEGCVACFIAYLGRGLEAEVRANCSSACRTRGDCGGKTLETGSAYRILRSKCRDLNREKPPLKPSGGEQEN